MRAYKERGNINTPLKLAILNQTDRFTLLIDVIDWVPGLAARAARLKEQMKNEIIRHLAYAHEHGTDLGGDRQLGLAALGCPFPLKPSRIRDVSCGRYCSRAHAVLSSEKSHDTTSTM